VVVVEKEVGAEEGQRGGEGMRKEKKLFKASDEWGRRGYHSEHKQ
jgi:hypothetical protein